MASGDASSLAAETKPVGAEETDGDADTFVIPENVNQPTYSNVAQRMMVCAKRVAAVRLPLRTEAKPTERKASLFSAVKLKSKQNSGVV